MIQGNNFFVTKNLRIKNNVASHTRQKFHTVIIKRSVKDNRSMSIDLKNRQQNTLPQEHNRSKSEQKSKELESLQISYNKNKFKSLLLQQPSVNKIRRKVLYEPIRSKKQSKSIEGVNRKMYKIDKVIDFIESNKKVRAVKSQEKRSKLSKTYYKTKQMDQQLLKPAILNKDFEGYLDFIQADKSVYTYHLHYNFDSLRNKTKKNAFKELNHDILKLIEGILECIYENLIAPSETTQSLISEYCTIYFSCFEKVEFELIISHHFLKTLEFRIRPIFVYLRLVMYILSKLSSNGLLLDLLNFSPLKIVFKYLKESYYYNLLKNVLEIQNDSNVKINQTFKILKTIADIQKKIHIISAQIGRLNYQSFPQINAIDRSLRHFLSGKQISTEKLLKVQMQLSWKYLKIPPVPHLPSKKSQKIYTIVLDIDETLISYSRQTRILKYRPYIDIFLKNLSANFELIAFTASSKDYTDSIITQIEKSLSIFDFRLCRQHLTLINGRMIKDISKLGRPLSHTLIIDNVKANFSNYPQNGIEISTWRGDRTDCKLANLLTSLNQLASGKHDNVRSFLLSLQQNLIQISEEVEYESSEN